MFKRKPRIKSITMAVAGDFMFTLGLGKDGKVYSWNTQICQWTLHQAPTPPAQEEADAS